MHSKSPSKQNLKIDPNSTIEDVFKKMIKERYEMMLKKQAENPNLIIPKNFERFIHTKLFMEFLLSIYDYCVDLNMVEKKSKILEFEVLIYIMIG